MKYIYGIGNNTKNILQMYDVNIDIIDGYIETEKTKEIFNEKKVFKVTEINPVDVEWIFVTSSYSNSIYNSLIKYGFEMKKVFFLYPPIPTFYHLDYSSIKELSEGLWRYLETNRVHAVGINENDINENTYMKKLVIPYEFYVQDYFRYRTFELIAEMIKERNIEGDCAELGVYKGTFSALIKKWFPNKKMFLFDTFEGFSVEEIVKERQRGSNSETFLNAFKDTSVELVEKNINDNTNLIIKKGIFPDTTQDMEKNEFAFVSIDVDLEESIYNGLKWFYPRIVDGGIIMLHDYNNVYVKSAVQKYQSVLGVALKMIPLADKCGTLVIMK